MASMILKRGLRFAEFKCPRRFFSSSGSTLGEYGQFQNSSDNGKDLHGDLAWMRNQQIKTVKSMEEQEEASARAAQLQALRNNKWKTGDVYAPHDLTKVEWSKRSRIRLPNQDIFDVLGINPLHEYKNPSIMWEYMAPMGRIKHRKETGLRPVNQRRLAKAIRRAVGMGLIPSVHRHPEVLEADALKREQVALDNPQGIARNSQLRRALR